MFDIKQATFLDGIVSSHQRFKIERSFLLRGHRNLIECKILLQGLLLCAMCEGDASPCSKSTIFYEPIVSMLINLQCGK